MNTLSQIIKSTLVIFAGILILSACQSPKEKSLKAIKNMEGNDSAFSNELMMQLKTAYTDFALAYPDDEHTPEFLFKAAQRAIVLQQANEAVDLLIQLINKYPANEFAEDATFLLAFTYENNLNDLTNARVYYEKFLKEYP
ncbi:MAG: tetratricopeptide repeat protein, partial [Bacteroidia bacterium]|nr:tetratricopeptide repeat protein [Bacteroidia bacterium]